MEKRFPPLVVGVAGGSGSGKTTIVNTIAERVEASNIAYLPHDAFYKDLKHLAPSEREKINYDHPDSLDTSLLIQLLNDLRNYRPVQRPVYDFITHTRMAESILIEPKPLVIVEGILILADPELRSLFDMKIFVDTEPDVRFIRRFERNISERKHTSEYAIKQYMSTVRPMHRQFVEPSKDYADLIIPGDQNEVALDVIVTYIKVKIRGEHN